MTKLFFNLSALLGIVFMISLQSCSTFGTPAAPMGEANPELGIENVIPSELNNLYKKHFNRYTKVTAPNGGIIHIVAQSDLSEDQIVRCRSILEHYLHDFPGSEFGNDKSEIANKMAENNAILCLLNGQDDGKNKVANRITGQALFQNEIQVEGHDWYINQNYKHRDAAYEEILHLVHDTGIGVDGKNTNPGAAPEFQQKIRAAQESALENKIWGLDSDAWIKELRNENSLSQEYLAAVIDAYYGLWGAWTENATHGMGGVYLGKDREDMKTDDPMGFDIADGDFFHPYLTYNARIDASFSGTFSLKFDSAKPYTHHAQYLKDITLTGNNDTDVVVNSWDNVLQGNSGMNTVIFSGNKAEYTIEKKNDVTTITHSVSDGDGTNVISGFEKAQFADETIDL